jgi:hypothetical protein
MTSTGQSGFAIMVTNTRTGNRLELCRVGLQPPSRLEAVAQNADEQEADCNHAGIMF